MGLKLSCIHRGSLSTRQVTSLPAAPVRVIAADGSLKEFPAASPPTAVSDALDLIVVGSGDAAAASSFFVCNSDALYFNETPPALPRGELLRPAQIYFVLPTAALGRPLSSADMAELAVRATAALASSSKGNKQARRRRYRRSGGKAKVRVVPVRDGDRESGGGGGGGADVFFNRKLNEHTLGEFGRPAMSPAKSDQKVVAAKAAARSRLRRALSIIREDAE